jgi:hypothetical protein
MPLRVLWLYADDMGETHVELVGRVPPPAGRPDAVAPIPVSSFAISEVPEGPGVVDFHPAPQRQFVTLLSGSTQLVTSDGTSMPFRAGDLLFVEDVVGKGHRWIGTTGERQVVMTLPVPEDWRLQAWEGRDHRAIGAEVPAPLGPEATRPES